MSHGDVVSGLCSDSDSFKWPQFMAPSFSIWVNAMDRWWFVMWSGDDDAACATSGEEYWLNRWKNYVRDHSTNWLPWKSDDLQLGGYHTIYHHRNNMDFNALHLITVRSAGHMVPTTQPGRSLTVLRKFLFEFSDYPTERGKGGWWWIEGMTHWIMVMMMIALCSFYRICGIESVDRFL